MTEHPSHDEGDDAEPEVISSEQELAPSDASPWEDPAGSWLEEGDSDAG